jgi:hypothetical protein
LETTSYGGKEVASLVLAAEEVAGRCRCRRAKTAPRSTAALRVANVGIMGIIGIGVGLPRSAEAISGLD